jgi:hypothetical protein
MIDAFAGSRVQCAALSRERKGQDNAKGRES